MVRNNQHLASIASNRQTVFFAAGEPSAVLVGHNSVQKPRQSAVSVRMGMTDENTVIVLGKVHRESQSVEVAS